MPKGKVLEYPKSKTLLNTNPRQIINKIRAFFIGFSRTLWLILYSRLK